MENKNDISLYEKKLEDLNKNMRNHKLFKSISDIESLRIFMQWHVFAVWDFMSLAKRLQNELTCTSLPWLPPKNPKASRIMNEIILGEESDEDLNGSHYSHFEMYLMAMDDIKSNKDDLLKLINEFNSPTKEDYTKIIQRQNIPEYVKKFVINTLDTAIKGSLNEVLGAFFYGREDAIPEMFQNLLKNWGLSTNEFPSFVYYLERHIELDGDSHGPAINNIINKIKDDHNKYQELILSAIKSVEYRIQFWDGILDDLEKIIQNRKY